METRILVVSSANMDMVLNVDFVPEAGHTIIDNGSYSYVPGGKGANSALAFTRLGADCTFLTRLGEDSTGDKLLALYEEAGIDTKYITRTPNAPTGFATIFVEASGQNRIIVFPGANQRVTERVIEGAFCEDYNALYLQFEINYDAIIYSAQHASKMGIPIFVDAGAVSLDFPFKKLPPLEIFSPNESETLTLVGIFPDDEEKCKEAAIAISELVDSKYIVIKLGARGAYIWDGENGMIMPTLPIKAVDSTAAGDAFTAGLTLEYLRCGDIYKACEYGNIVGSITVSRKGASSSIPTSEEVEEFMDKIK